MHNATFSVKKVKMFRQEDQNIDKFFGVYERPVRWERPELFLMQRRRTMTVKKDCFAYRISGCSIMTETICRRHNCSFYKTKEQAEADREKYGFQKNYKPKSDRS